MKLIDTHCHLTHGRLAHHLPQALERAWQAGLAACVCASADLSESAASAALALRESAVYFMAGVHPHEAGNAAPDYLARIEALAAQTRNVAIGEIGLDYHYNFSPPDAQRRVFAEQLDLARRLQKPVVIHTREAFEDTLAILRHSGMQGSRVAFHSFTQGPEQVRLALELGATVGFSGIATFKNASAIRQGAQLVPDDRILIETDCPYLSPEPVRAMKTNEPANVVHVASCLAAVRGVSVEQFANATTANAVAFFGLDVR